jgi:anti-sigma-K factor RskA
VDIQAYIQSGVIESYVLGLASSNEVTELESMRLKYTEIDEAINEFAVSLEKQALENSVPPPDDLKEKILKAIRDEELSTPVIPIQKGNEEHFNTTVHSIRPWRMAAAASIILLIVSTALNYYLYQQYHNKNEAYQALLSDRNTLQANNQIYQTNLREWEEAAAMMANPKMATVKLKGIPGKEANMATILWDTGNKDVYVMANRLEAPSKGKQYQLWAIVDGKPVDAGTLDAECIGVCKMKNIPKAEAFAITLENVGGSQTPTLTAMLVHGSV